MDQMENCGNGTIYIAPKMETRNRGTRQDDVGVEQCTGIEVLSNI